jgi:hypothetical protein
MDDSDLNYLRRILGRMDGDDMIGIGVTNWDGGRSRLGGRSGD